MPQVAPIIIAGAAAIGASAAAAAGFATLATVISIAGTILSIVVGILLAPSAPKPRGSREREQAIREPAQARTMAWGTVRLAAEAHPVFDANDTNHFVRLMALNWGPIDSYLKFYLNSEEVSVDGSNLVTGSQDGKWDGKVEIVTTLGDPDQPALAEALTHYPGKWTIDHRCRNTALGWVRQIPVSWRSDRARHLHQELDLQVDCKAAADIYDPRTETTGWSDNCALVLLWYWTHRDGRGFDLEADIDIESMKWAADVCDELVPLRAGGTEKRYRTNGQIGLDEDPNDITARLLQTMDAVPTLTTDGKLGVRIGTPPQNEWLTITAADVISTEFQAGPRGIDRYNRVLPVFISPEHNFQEITLPPREDATSVATHGASTFRLSLPYAASQGQCQRLAKKEFLKLNAAELATIRVGPVGILAREGTVIVLGYENAEYAGPLRVKRREINPRTMVVTLEVYAIAADYDEWDETTEEQLVAPLPTTFATASVVPLPTGVVISSEAVGINANTVGVGARLDWTSPADPTLTAEVDVDPGGFWQPVGAVDADEGKIITPPLEDQSLVRMRIRFVGPGGGKSAYVTTGLLQLVADGAAIAAPALTGGGEYPTEGTNFNIAGTAPTVATIWQIGIYHNTTNNFGTASEFARIFVLPGQFFSKAATSPAMGTTDYYWSVSRNTSGIDGPELSPPIEVTSAA